MTETTAEIIDLTPEHAAMLLGHNPRNRRLNPARVAGIVKIIQSGEWRLSNDAICLNGGVLLNGQHRCAAVVQTDQSVPVLFMRDVPSSTQMIMDTGRARNLNDALFIRGEKSTTSLASAINWYTRMTSGGMRSGGWTKISIPTAIDLLDREPGLRDSLRRANRLRTHLRGVGEGLWGALIYLFDGIDPDDCEVFISGLEIGTGLSDTDPRWRLREWLQREAAATRKAAPWFQAAMAIKAWNFWRDGAEVRNLSFRPGGRMAEKFPEAH